MIGLHVSVPIACWRKGGAREFWETEMLPPPATCYGALLSLVGETNRFAHLGARVTAGLLNSPFLNSVLRTLWRVKDGNVLQGNGVNARPDIQQLWCKSELMIWCDSGDETVAVPLEHRVVVAIENPKEISRFGGWCLGESTHLINDAWLIRDSVPPSTCHAFLLDKDGSRTMPIWVDHVGMSGTQYEVGNIVKIDRAPLAEQLPMIQKKQ